MLGILAIGVLLITYVPWLTEGLLRWRVVFKVSYDIFQSLVATLLVAALTSSSAVPPRSRRP